MYSMYICIIVRCVYNLQKHTRSWNSWKHQTITQATAKPSLKLPLQPFPPPEHRTFWRIDNYWWTKTWSKYGYIYICLYVCLYDCMYIYVYVHVYVNAYMGVLIRRMDWTLPFGYWLVTMDSHHGFTHWIGLLGKIYRKPGFLPKIGLKAVNFPIIQFYDSPILGILIIHSIGYHRYHWYHRICHEKIPWLHSYNHHRYHRIYPLVN